jgi:tetratricopeptide (TPR) repeat protein
MTDTPTPKELSASMEAWQKRLAFEKEVCATPRGRRSFELRQRALARSNADEHKEAFALYEEAAGMHAEDDPSPAAAMCWFDLALSYTYRAEGVKTADLRTAEHLFRRALCSPALAMDPHRMGMVRDALASCLRNLAHEPMEHHREKALLAEATDQFEEAVKIALSMGPVGYEGVVRFSHNLSNCLSQQGRLDEALLAMDRAEAYALRLEGLVRSEEQVRYLSMILVHGAQQRDARGREGDRMQAVRALREVIALGHPSWMDIAELRLAGMLLRDPAVSRDEALAELRKARVDRIPPKHRAELLSHYIDTGLRREALVLLQQQLQGALASWRDAMADHIADHHAATAQKAAHLAARLHLEEEDALEAFLTLEDVSGLRFAEVVDARSRLIRSPIVRVLGGHHHAKSLLSVFLEDRASRIAHGHVDVHELLDQARVTAARAAKAEDQAPGSAARLVEVLDEAAKHPDPVGFLRRKARQVGEEVIRLKARMREIEPGLDACNEQPWLYRLTKEVVRDLLREHTDHALVRLSLAEDLLVIAIWLDGDEVVARHHRVPVPRLLFERLAAYQAGSRDADLLDQIAADLEALDLSPALPGRRMAHAVLLPSYVASFLPLGALGPAGRTLLDQFDALSWMPCLAPLFIRQAALGPRDGVVSVAPGRTHYHSFAFGVALPGERRIEGREATEDQVLAAARHADVVSLYAHGKHGGERGRRGRVLRAPRPLP